MSTAVHASGRNDREDRDLQLLPAPPSARAWLLALVVLVPVAATGAIVAFTLAGGDGPRVVDASAAASGLAVTGGVAVVSGLLWLGLDRLLRRHRLDVGADGIDVRTTFYRKQLALDALQLDQARVVALAERTEFKPMLKLNGTALPGFQSGWFLLRDRSRAFVAISGGPRVLWLPTQRGHALLLQPRQPEALLARLRELAAAPARR